MNDPGTRIHQLLQHPWTSHYTRAHVFVKYYLLTNIEKQLLAHSIPHSKFFIHQVHGRVAPQSSIRHLNCSNKIPAHTGQNNLERSLAQINNTKLGSCVHRNLACHRVFDSQKIQNNLIIYFINGHTCILGSGGHVNQQKAIYLFQCKRSSQIMHFILPSCDLMLEWKITTIHILVLLFDMGVRPEV